MTTYLFLFFTWFCINKYEKYDLLQQKSPKCVHYLRNMHWLKLLKFCFSVFSDIRTFCGVLFHKNSLFCHKSAKFRSVIFSTHFITFQTVYSKCCEIFRHFKLFLRLNEQNLVFTHWHYGTWWNKKMFIIMCDSVVFGITYRF